jgi:2-oxoisovalerate dehydrogenase E1 component
MAAGYPPIEVRKVDGADLIACISLMEEVINLVREERRPFLIHATVPLLGHHTSGVRREFYRDDIDEATKRDPIPRIEKYLIDSNILDSTSLALIKAEIDGEVNEAFDKARNAEEPVFEDLLEHRFAPTKVVEELGTREPKDGELTLMVDCALHAMQEIMTKHPESLLYGQDVGKRLGGVFREAATLGNKFGDDRVFNTPIQEAFIIGSTVGMSCTGLKPIVEVQFADYLWPGLNQLFSELSRSYFLSNGKWPVHSLIRVPIGAYGSGGPYHSSSIESVLTNIRGIKVAYPSNGADLKGLLKAAFHDPNPVVVLEHKGLYWSKIPGTEAAKCIEPSEDYIIPLGKARVVQRASKEVSCSIITYGRGVYWAMEASANFPGAIEIIDLRTLAPLDFQTVADSIKRTNRCLVLTEEPVANSFAQALSGRIAQECFEDLDAAPEVLGSVELPAIPLNESMEKEVLPDAEKVSAVVGTLLDY